VTAPPLPSNTVPNAGILTVNVRFENWGEGQMAIHSKFDNTPDPSDNLLEGITVTVNNAKFVEPAHNETSNTDQGTRFFVPSGNTSSNPGNPFDYFRTFWYQIIGQNTQNVPPILTTDGKVTLCHVTGSETNPSETISVNADAVPGHLAHGDSVGICAPNNIQPGATAVPVGPRTGKVTLCHVTGSQKNPGVTLTVSQNAVQAHLGHGDTVGPCVETDKGKPDDKGKPSSNK